jgi:hypothetical protein
MHKMPVSSKKLHNEYTKSASKGEPTRELLLMFHEIAKFNGSRIDAKCKQDVDSCVSYGLTKAWQKWDKFSISRSESIVEFFNKMIKSDMFMHYKKITRDRYMFVSIDALFVNNPIY